MMSYAASPSQELVKAIELADAALARGDMETAQSAMATAADFCRRLHDAGMPVSPDELRHLQELWDHCGAELGRLGRDLNALSLRKDNLVRGIRSYHATLRR